MKFWLCCEVRADKHDDYRGYALLIDYDTMEVLDEFHGDDGFGKEERRGLRQMTQFKDEIYVLWNCGVQVVDAHTRKTKRLIVQPYIYGGHYWYSFGDGTFWYNANVFDAMLRVDAMGKVCEWVWTGPIFGYTDHAPRTMLCNKGTDKDIEYLKDMGVADQLHNNCVQYFKERMYAGSCTHKSLYAFRPFKSKIFSCDLLDSPHDFYLFDERTIVVCDSGHESVCIFDRGKPTPTLLKLQPGQRECGTNSRYGYARGLMRIDDERVLVGSAPLSVFIVNVRTRQVEGMHQYHHRGDHTCHGISMHEDERPKW